MRAARVDAFGVSMDNPNYKNAGVLTCACCGEKFKHYNKTRKYCSLQCSMAARSKRVEKICEACGVAFFPANKKAKTCSLSCWKSKVAQSAKREKTVARSGRVYAYTPRPRPVHLTNCLHCGVEFRFSPSTKRKFCSYACHLASGGAQRAGEASSMATRKYGAKKDANHSEIFEIIGKFTAVKDLSAVGCGVPDGIAWVNDGWQLFDVKNPSTGYGRRGLNPRQKKWAEDWRGGPVYLLYTIEEAERFARGNLEGIKRHDPLPKAVALNAAGIPFRGVQS